MLLKRVEMYFYMRTLRKSAKGGGAHVPLPTPCSLMNHLFFSHVATWWRTRVPASDTGVLFLLVSRTEHVHNQQPALKAAASLFQHRVLDESHWWCSKRKIESFLWPFPVCLNVFVHLLRQCIVPNQICSYIWQVIFIAVKTVRTSSRMDFSPVTNKKETRDFGWWWWWWWYNSHLAAQCCRHQWRQRLSSSWRGVGFSSTWHNYRQDVSTLKEKCSCDCVHNLHKILTVYQKYLTLICIWSYCPALSTAFIYCCLEPTFSSFLCFKVPWNLF